MRLKKRQFKLTLPAGEINVVSLMDILTTLLFFLLIVASFSHLSFVEGTGLVNQPQSAANNLPKFALEVIFNSPTTATVWLGPLNGLNVNEPAQFEQFLQTQFQAKGNEGFIKKLTGTDSQNLIAQIQQTLIPIKRGFPDQLSVVAALSDQIPYQQMIDSVSGIRSLGEKQESIDLTDSQGRREKTKVLFPQVIISEWAEGV
jgi:biopolymer transport protein ExbD